MPKIVTLAFLPKDCEAPNRPHQQISNEQGEQMYKHLLDSIAAAKGLEGEKAFAEKVEGFSATEPVVYKFSWHGDATASVVFAREADGVLNRLEAITLLLGRVDKVSDDATIERLRKHDQIAPVIPESAYARVANEEMPMAATFFVNAKAADDDLIHNTARVFAGAFLHHVYPPRNVSMKFAGVIAYPGMEVDVDRDRFEEIILTDEQKMSLLREFDPGIKSGNPFIVSLNFSGIPQDVTIRFAPVSASSAYCMLSYDVDGQPEHIHGLTALLTKLDHDDDRRTIETVKKFAAIQGIPDTAFDAALESSEPVAASFFADSGSAHYAPVLTLIKTFAAAYFAQFGIGEG